MLQGLGWINLLRLDRGTTCEMRPVLQSATLLRVADPLCVHVAARLLALTTWEHSLDWVSA